jgi:hypothetical protein
VAKGNHAEAAQVAQEAIDQSREVQRAKYELAARLVPGALMALGQPERGSTSCARARRYPAARSPAHGVASMVDLGNGARSGRQR